MCSNCVLCRATQPQTLASLATIAIADHLELVCMNFIRVGYVQRWLKVCLVTTDRVTRYTNAVPTINFGASVSRGGWRERVRELRGEVLAVLLENLNLVSELEKDVD